MNKNDIQDVKCQLNKIIDAERRLQTSREEMYERIIKKLENRDDIK